MKAPAILDFTCLQTLQTVRLTGPLNIRQATNYCRTNASQRRVWRMSQPQVMTVLVLHLTHTFICVGLLMFCRCDMKPWWRSGADSHINTFWGRAASPRDDAYSWSLPQSHNTFSDNTRTMVIQTYCRRHTISNIMPSVLSNHIRLLHCHKVRDSFWWFIVSFFSTGFYVGKHIN